MITLRPTFALAGVLAWALLGCGESQPAKPGTPVAAGPSPPTAPADVSVTPDPADAAPPPFVGKRLGIVLTANVMGELEPCG